jgi:hypothetical protein
MRTVFAAQVVQPSAEATLGRQEGILEGRAPGRSGDLDAELRRARPVRAIVLKRAIEPRGQVPGRPGVRLGEQHPEAGRPGAYRSIRLPDFDPDQVGQAPGSALERGTAWACFEVDQEDRGRATVAGMPGRFTEQRRRPVGSSVEVAGTPRSVAVIDGEIGPLGPTRRAIQEGLDPSRKSLVVPIVREHETRRPARSSASALASIYRFSHKSASLAPGARPGARGRVRSLPTLQAVDGDLDDGLCRGSAGATRAAYPPAARSAALWARLPAW